MSRFRLPGALGEVEERSADGVGPLVVDEGDDIAVVIGAGAGEVERGADQSHVAADVDLAVAAGESRRAGVDRVVEVGAGGEGEAADGKRCGRAVAGREDSAAGDRDGAPNRAGPIERGARGNRDGTGIN
jgi:hypothetical protein